MKTSKRYETYPGICKEAADEIEMLRAELDKLRSPLSELVSRLTVMHKKARCKRKESINRYRSLSEYYLADGEANSFAIAIALAKHIKRERQP